MSRCGVMGKFVRRLHKSQSDFAATAVADPNKFGYGAAFTCLVIIIATKVRPIRKDKAPGVLKIQLLVRNIPCINIGKYNGEIRVILSALCSYGAAVKLCELLCNCKT